MFKIGDVVEITEESDAAGMLDFVKGNSYAVSDVRISPIAHVRQVYIYAEGDAKGWYAASHFKPKEDTIVEKKEYLFKEGQVVWDVVYGKGVVVEIAEYSVYPVVVQFSDETMAYSEDGKTYETHGRTLFFSEPRIEAATEPLFEPTLKKDDVVVLVCKAYGKMHIVKVFEETEDRVESNEGTRFAKCAYDYYRLGEKINFK